MKRRCSSCNGTGRESCEVHGSHICDKCNGSGCVDSGGVYFPNPRFTCTQPITKRWMY